MAGLAHRIAGLGGAAPAQPGHPQVQVERLLRDLLDHPLSLGPHPLPLVPESRMAGVELAVLDPGLGLDRREGLLLASHIGGESLRALHLLEDLVLVTPDVPLHGLDLVEHGGVLLVGLHVHELTLVLRALLLEHLDLGLVVLSGLLGRLERPAGALHASLLTGHALIEGLAESRNFGQLGVEALELGFGVVEVDDLFEVGIHYREDRRAILAPRTGAAGGRGRHGPGRTRTFDEPVMSRPF